MPGDAAAPEDNGPAAPIDPGRVLFPSVHGTGVIRSRAMSGDAVYAMIRARAEQEFFHFAFKIGAVFGIEWR